MANRYPLILNSAAGQLQELPVGDSLDLGGESLLGIKLGSAGVPSISFTGDTNTGIYSPGTDQVAVATNGVGRLFVASDGSIEALSGTSDRNLIVRNTVNNTRLQIKTTAANKNSEIWFGDADDDDVGIIDYDHDGDYLRFYTNASEKLRITSAGLVGIGTSSVSNKLVVNVGTAATDGIYLYGTGGSTPTIYFGHDGSHGTDATISSNPSTGHFQIVPRSGYDTVFPSGRVGIGTTNPGALLDVNASSGDNFCYIGSTGSTKSGFQFRANNTSYAEIYFDNSSSYPLVLGTKAGAGPVVFNVADNEAARIDSSGNVGIGVSAPAAGLDVSSGAARAGRFIRTDANPSNDTYALEIDNSAQTSNVSSAGALKVTVNSGTAAVIDGLGNVGIGTTSPDGLLHLAGSAASLYFEDTASSNTLSRIYKSGSSLLINSRHTTAGQIVFNSENSYGTVSERMRIDSSGRLLVGTSSSLTGTNSQYAYLQIRGNSAGASTAGQINLARNLDSASVVSGHVLGRLVFADQQAGEYAYIEAVADATPGVGDYPGRLVFSTTADGASNPTERMRIDSSGNVGIGTTSPISQLEINEPTNASCFVNITARGGNALKSVIFLRTLTSGGATAGGAIYHDGDGLVFNKELSSNTESVRIDSSGRLLVGTSSQGSSRNIYGVFQLEGAQVSNNAWANFTQYGNSYSNRGARLYLNFTPGTSSGSATAVTTEDELGAIHFRGANGTTFQSAAEIRGETDTGTISGTSMPGRLVFSTTADGASSPTERMRITSAGNVGIGTTSPDAALQITKTSAGSDPIHLLLSNGSASAGTTSSIYFAPNVVGSIRAAAIKGVNEDGGNSTALTFFTNSEGNAPTERARIDSSGRLLVGTSTSRGVSSSTNATVQVETTTYIGYSVINNTNNNGGPAIALGKSRGTSVGSSTVVQSGDDLGSIIFAGADGTNLESQAASIKCSVDATPGANDMPGRLVFSTTADGASSPTERMRIDSSGNVGIGTSSPGQQMVVRGSQPFLEIRDSRTGNWSGEDVFSGILFGTDDTTTAVDPHAFIKAVHTRAGSGHSSADAGLTFGTSASTTTPATERMRIDDQGRVGIGTTSPAQALSVVGNILAAGSEASHYVASSKAGVTTTYLITDANGGNIQIDGVWPIRFTTNGSERARIDSSGRLLVGTSTSRTNGDTVGSFQLSGNVDSGSISQFVYTNDIYGPRLSLGKSRGTTDGTFTVVQDDDNLGTINFSGADGTDLATRAATIAAYVDGTPGSNDMPGRLVFSTNAGAPDTSPTERLRISRRGLISGTSETHWGQIGTTQAASGTASFLLSGYHSGTAGSGGTGTLSFRVWTNGDVVNTNNSYGALSDLKLKENIVDAGSQWDDLKALQVRNYNFKPETNQQTHTQIGLIAQEVELVSPGLVSESPDRDEDGNDLGTVTKSVNYSVLYMKAVKALQEAMERIETLEAKVAALESA